MGNVKRSSQLSARHRARIKATKAACWLCGVAIDYALPHTDPMSFVIDHIVPISKGGEDALSNIKAAHRR